jgi:hypothetical protein
MGHGLDAHRRTAPVARLISNITIDEDVVLANWRQHTRFFAALTLSLIAIVLGLAFLLARMFRRQDRILLDLTRARQVTEEEAAANVRLLDNLRSSEAHLTESPVCWKSRWKTWTRA